MEARQQQMEARLREMQELHDTLKAAVEEDRRDERHGTQASQAPFSSPGSQCASAPLQPSPGGPSPDPVSSQL